MTDNQTLFVQWIFQYMCNFPVELDGESEADAIIRLTTLYNQAKQAYQLIGSLVEKDLAGIK